MHNNISSQCIGNNTCHHIWLSIEHMVLLCMSGGIMVLLGILGNTVMVWLIWRHSTMHSTINILLGSLAMCDLLLVNVSLPFNILGLVTDNGRPCMGQASLLLLLIIQGNIPLIAACVHRYYTAVYHIEWLTVQSALYVVGLSWLLATIFVLPPLLPFVDVFFSWCGSNNNNHINTSSSIYAVVILIVALILPFLIMIYVCKGIIYHLRQTNSKVHNLPDFSSAITEVDLRRHVPPIKQNHAFVTLFILCLIFLFTKSPVLIIQVSYQLTGKMHSSLIWLVWWVYLGPTLNPVLYITRLPRYRQALLKSFPALQSLFRRTQTSQYNQHDLYVVSESPVRHLNNIQHHGKVTPQSSTDSYECRKF